MRGFGFYFEQMARQVVGGPLRSAGKKEKERQNAIVWAAKAETDGGEIGDFGAPCRRSRPPRGRFAGRTVKTDSRGRSPGTCRGATGRGDQLGGHDSRKTSSSPNLSPRPAPGPSFLAQPPPGRKKKPATEVGCCHRLFHDGLELSSPGCDSPLNTIAITWACFGIGTAWFEQGSSLMALGKAVELLSGGLGARFRRWGRAASLSIRSDGG